MTGTDKCAMSESCADKPADRGMMCVDHRAESDEIERLFSDDVDPAARDCTFCADPDDPGTPLFPMYGVAPHECFWRKGPQFTIGQSTLVPLAEDQCFVPDLEPGETWTDFGYPSACGIFYCPNCHAAEYRAAWAALVERIGEPPASVGTIAAAIGREVGDG